MDVWTVFICWVYLMPVLHGKPTDPKIGPCVGMDCLHGVLMHNDEAQNGDHTAEDQYLRFKDKLKTEKPTDGPLNAEETFHAALMHGNDEESAKRDNLKEVLPEIKSKAGPQDLNDALHDLMHDKDKARTHSWGGDSQSPDDRIKGPPDADQMMHGVLMHGDAAHVGHVEEKKEEATNEKAGPQTGEDLMHGILMHGDVKAGRRHATDASEVELQARKALGPDSDQLHGILMHGDKEIGQDHSEEHKKLASDDVFSDISKLLEMDLDEDLLKIIDFKKILEKDREEYKEWILNNPQFQDEGMMGSTYLSISDSIYDDIQLMKKRYLNKEQTLEDKNVVESEIKDLPFTAEDARDILDRNSLDHGDDDARHDLELIGSTEPINARHKVHSALENLQSGSDD